MTKRRHQTSIHRHLASVGAFITSAVGGVFLLVLIGVSFETSRTQVIDRNAALGSVLASNLTASIVFRDPATAAELLNGLSTVVDVLEAEVRLADGAHFASYQGPSRDGAAALSTATIEALEQPIWLEGERIAALTIRVNLWPVYVQFLWISGLAVALWLLGMVAAYFFSKRLNAGITRPLTQLADMMSDVTQREDYSQRFSYGVQNELGSVVDAFNEMLERIGDRERQLKGMIRELEEARDQAESAARSKSSFLANMSHEIRTPMNGVVGMIALLKQGELSDQQRAYFETIERSADALLLIIDDILDFTKIESGHLTLIKEPFDLRDSLTAIEALFQEPAAQKDLALGFSVSEAVPARVIGDPGRVRQVLLNLIGNAIKFTEVGSVHVEIGVKGSGTSSTLVFSVKDSGPGIDREDLDRIFGEFYQADVSLTREHGGTGLGLAIARQLVTLMEGDIGCTSTAATGSTFWVEIPLLAASGNVLGGSSIAVLSAAQSRSESARLERLTNPGLSEAAPDTARTEHPRLARSDLSVLIAEDSEVNQFIIRELLAKWGLEAAVVGNGLEAIAAFKARAFDLILMDIQMPEMDGLEATRQIKLLQQSEGLHPECIIVGLSAHAMSGDRERYLGEGMMDYLTKPIRTEALSEVLDACLSLTGIKPDI
ncbi:MAG: ATP-binding protein [Luminiphilus sp.]|nr:ATP-binding protein [Luminiphilus sp.]